MPNWMPTSFTVFTGENDRFEFGINGLNKELTISPGVYTHHSFLNELNLELNKNDIPLIASFEENTRKLQFISPVGDFTIDSITGNAAEGYLLPLSVANRTGGVSVAGLPILSPSVTINFGVNDTLTLDVNSTTYSITITPGTYTVYGASQSGANTDSPFLSEINEQLTNAGAPVNAKFIYYANSDSPFNNGAGLYLTAIENTDSSSYLSDGTHTFGNFGGNARTTLFDQIADGWNVIDSSTVKTGSVITSPSGVRGEADLSNGLTIISGENDTLTFNINGTTNSIVLREGTYNSSDLIDELNFQFNNNSIGLNADLNSLSKLVISQTTPYDGDSINQFSGNAMLDLLYEVVQGEEPILETVTNPSQGTLSIQVGPNSESRFKLALTDVRTTALGIVNLTVASRDGAESSIDLIDEAIQKVSSERSKFGAYQNRLEHTVQNNTIAFKNLTSAESRIRDVDYALAA
ncbi:hypothetical protein FZC75_10335 [Sutcliffiella horikoshii]|uniref:Flagellin C-terminal domain-containing protein n=2 Tax=Sutcliffiella horikoshii TaxID=79883 RepID=A0A5D4TCM0_9BACI|nr:hypothetical protein FZC75_10335 [Sutcliffiella horikoshii]